MQYKTIELAGSDSFWTHVFCGKSTFGNLRIDIVKRNNVNLVADVLDLPKILGNNSQPNIICDPAWQIPYQKHRYWVYALRDILKVGGFLMMNSTWSPECKGLELLQIWKVDQCFNSYRDLVDWWILRKIS